MADRSRRTGTGRRSIARAGGAALVVAVLVFGALVVGFSAVPPPSPAIQFAMSNETAALHGMFGSGELLSSASNGTATLFGGIENYRKTTDFSLPALAVAKPGPLGPRIQNLTAVVEPYFWQGGIYSIVWNGTAWLLTGQAGWGGKNIGTAVWLDGGRVTNLTPELGRYFPRGGIWTSAWNGSSWLVAGNSTAGPIAVALSPAGTTLNLSSRIVGHAPKTWIQSMGWNGHQWLLGGEGILGLFQGSSFTDLFPSAPYDGNGVYSIGWNGSSWLVGGGSGRASSIQSDRVGPGPTLPSDLDQSILAMTAAPAGWLIGGKGSSPTAPLAPGLAFWTAGGSLSTVIDLGPTLPAAFEGGEIWGATPIPRAASGYYVLGFGDYNDTSGSARGALAELFVTYAPPPRAILDPGKGPLATVSLRSVRDGAPARERLRSPGANGGRIVREPRPGGGSAPRKQARTPTRESSAAGHRCRRYGARDAHGPGRIRTVDLRLVRATS